MRLPPLLQRPFAIALAGLLAVVLWQLLIVAGHQWNLTALFCIGEKNTPPPALRSSVYQYPNSPGFDAQFYFYIAHDVTDRNGTSAYMDNQIMRWRRILFPGLAALLSFGQPGWVTPAYVVVMWLAASLGVYALARLCLHWGLPPVLGLAFLLVPATTISVDRMMTDIGIPLAVVLLALALREDRPVLALLTLALAPLARETGVVFIGAWVLWFAAKREWRKTALGAAAAIPALLWMAWVQARFDSDYTPWFGWPFQGILTRLTEYEVFQAPSLSAKLALPLEYLGALGIAASFPLALALWLRGKRSLLLLAAVLYTLGISIFAKEDMWWEAYSYTRTAGPVAAMLALLGLESRRWWLAVPMLLALPRIGLQLMWVTMDCLRGIGA